MSSVKQILITGPPGIGKSTLVRRVCDRLTNEKPDLKFTGFYTAEVRDSNGYRSGFEMVTFPNNTKVTLATVNPPTGYRGPTVSKYTVMVEDFETAAIPCLKNEEGMRLLVLDELGKMESFSKKFSSTFTDWLNCEQRGLLLATIPINRGRPLPMVEQVKEQEGNKLITLNKNNRDSQVDDIYNLIVSLLL